MLLATAAVATWTAYFAGKAQIVQHKNDIASYRLIEPRLEVADPKQIGAMQMPRWDDAWEWEVQVPEGTFRLNLAAPDVVENHGVPGLPEADRTTSLTPGRHRVVLEQTKEALVWSVDGKALDPLPRARPENRSTSWSGSHESGLVQDADKPLELMRLQESDGGSRQPSGVGKPGFLLWIERENDAP